MAGAVRVWSLEDRCTRTFGGECKLHSIPSKDFIYFKNAFSEFIYCCWKKRFSPWIFVGRYCRPIILTYLVLFVPVLGHKAFTITSSSLVPQVPHLRLYTKKWPTVSSSYFKERRPTTLSSSLRGSSEYHSWSAVLTKENTKNTKTNAEKTCLGQPVTRYTSFPSEFYPPNGRVRTQNPWSPIVSVHGWLIYLFIEHWRNPRHLSLEFNSSITLISFK